VWGVVEVLVEDSAPPQADSAVDTAVTTAATTTRPHRAFSPLPTATL
jgi:hypothetical protein